MANEPSSSPSPLPSRQEQFRVLRVPVGWTSKDLVTVAVSVCALCLSAFNFVQANLWVRESVVLQVIQTGGVFQDNRAMFKPIVAVVNRGNRPAVIVGFEFLVRMGNSWGTWNQPSLQSKFEPFQVQPGEVKAFALDASPLSEAEFMRNQQIELAVRSTVLNSAGVPFVSTYPIASIVTDGVSMSTMGLYDESEPYQLLRSFTKEPERRAKLPDK